MCDQVSFRVSAHFEPNVAQVHAHAHGPHANFWTRGCSLKISVVMPNGFGNDLCTPFDLASQHFKCQVARSL